MSIYVGEYMVGGAEIAATIKQECPLGSLGEHPSTRKEQHVMFVRCVWVGRED